MMGRLGTSGRDGSRVENERRVDRLRAWCRRRSDGRSESVELSSSPDLTLGLVEEARLVSRTGTLAGSGERNSPENSVERSCLSELAAGL